MVTFTCQHCNSSLKKNKVEKHYQFQCKRSPHLTCIDCLKDFLGDSYNAHTMCITEAEKYGGQGYKPKSVAVKQNAWLSVCQRVLDSKSLSGPQQRLLEECSKHTNVPRNKKKFHNFVANACKGFRNQTSLIDTVFDLLEAEFKKEKEERNNTNTANSKEDMKEEENDEEEKMSKRKRVESGSSDNASSPEVKDEKNGLTMQKKKKKKLSKEDIKKVFSDAVNLDSGFSLDSIPVVGEETNREKNEKRKKKKGSISEQVIEEETEENHIEGEDTKKERLSKKEKKKLKKEAKYQALIEAISNQVEEETETVAAENEEEVSEKRKKKKKDKKSKEEGQEEVGKENEGIENMNENEMAEENIVSEKFNWTQVIISLLSSTKDKEMSLKKLCKKVVTEYQYRKGDRESYEQITAKFNKKISKTMGVRVLKDRAKLMA